MLTAPCPGTIAVSSIWTLLTLAKPVVGGLVQTLRETGFNRTAAAARLGLSLRQIRYRIARLNIATPQEIGRAHV